MDPKDWTLFGDEGRYDLTLKWAPDTGAASIPRATGGEASSADIGPSIFTAIQEQLGLKLEPTKGPVQVLVIDHAEMPSENRNSLTGSCEKFGDRMEWTPVLRQGKIGIKALL